jgi:hypothetical protein
LNKIIEWINGNQTDISLFAGEFDKMVPSKNLKHFSTKIPHINALELSCGHNNLIEETARHLKTNENTPSKQQA